MTVRWLVGLFLTCVTGGSEGLYLIKDYYLNPSHSTMFGGGCGRSASDQSAYINSHINNLRIAKYGTNKDCYIVLDSTDDNARYHIKADYFNLPPPDENGVCDSDYVEFYDGPTTNKSLLYGKFCGFDNPEIRYENFPTQRYLTIRFVSNDDERYLGFKLLATKHTYFPCLEEQFHCTHENTCIADALRCDGTPHCSNEIDEDDCSTLETMIGAILRLGLGGIMGVGLAVLVGCCGIWVTVCLCNWCPSCPLYKRRKKKEINVNIKTNEGLSEPDAISQGDLTKPPPKYGEQTSQWGMTDIWST